MEISADMSAMIHKINTAFTAGAKQPAEATAASRPSETAAVAVQLKNGDVPIDFKASGSFGGISDLLRLAGFKATPETMKMLEALLTQGFPATKETLSALNQAMRLMDNDLGKAMFLLKNDLPVTAKNAETVRAYAQNERQLTSQIAQLAEAVSNLPEGELKEALVAKLLQSAPPDMPGKTAAAAETQQSPAQKTAESLPQTATPATEKGVPPQAAGETHSVHTNQAEKLQTVRAEQTGQPPETQEAAQDQSKKIAEFTKALSQINAARFKGLPPAEIAQQISAAVEKAMPPGKETEGFAKQLLALSESVFGKQSDIYGEIEKAVFAQKEPIAPEQKEPSLKDQIIQKFTLDPAADDAKSINRFLNALKETAETAKTTLAARELSPEISKIIQSAEDITKNLDFLDSMKNSVYMQLPMQIGNKPANVDLYVFNNKKNKRHGAQNTQSALIALDLLSLGHLETYIQKNGRTVQLQFRVADERIEKLIKTSTNLLNDQLARLNLTLAQCAYKKTEEPFQITDEEPLLDETALSDTRGIQTYDFKA
ncbi:MAG: hypothetical protein LBU77_00460 [Clostridiales bacterium]|jgi:hypothetical protein|nr:hypothetical protein [Clostridiales bacterium]